MSFKTTSTTTKQSINSMAIETLGLTLRTNNCLKSENIHYVGELVQHTEYELLRIPNLGRRSMNELIESLAIRNITLGGKNVEACEIECGYCKLIDGESHAQGAYAEILAALESVAGEVTDGVRPTSADSHLPADIVRLVHSAIAKATGKAES